ncbi:MAG: T9SS type A sorting domain-containing protein [Lishizhenia sp.]
MKIFILATTLLLTTNSVFGQISISANDFNQDAADYVLSQSIETNLNTTTTGSNVTWDFSSLSANSQYTDSYLSMSTAPFFVQALFGPFAPTEYKADYYKSASTLPFDLLPPALPLTIEDVNQFTKITPDSLTYIGFSLVANGQEIPFRSDTVEKGYEFPLEFGNTYSSRAYTEADLNPIFDARFIQYKQRSSFVDGWGTITTPYGTFSALRVKHSISEIDSVYIAFGGVGSWLQLPVPNSTIYEWWTNNEDIPLLTITTQDVLGQEQISSVEYKDNPQPGLGLTSENQHTDIKVSNPVKNVLHIYSEKQLIKATLYDLNGKKVIQNNGLKEMDVSNLPNGFYQLLVETDKEIESIKVVLQN